MLEVREPRDGAGRLGWRTAGGACAGCGGDREGSRSSSPVSDSLEAEPDSSKKLRVFLTAVASLSPSFPELDNEDSHRKSKTKVA